MTRDFHAGALFWRRGLIGSKPGYSCADRVHLQKTNATEGAPFYKHTGITHF